MKLLLTGASGYLGQHILNEFMKNPPSDVLHIHALYYSLSGFEEALNATIMRRCKSDCSIRIQVEAVDITNPAAVKSFFERHKTAFDVCVHTAAVSVPGLCQQDPDKAHRINNPKPFFDALIRSKTRIIALSTDQVYSGDPSKAPFSETDSTEPVNVYGQSKVEMENYLQSNHAKHSVILRSSIILGPKAPIHYAHDTFLHFIASRENQETSFFTDEKRSVIFVQDVIACIEWFVVNISSNQHHVAGVYNLGGPNPVSRMDIAKAVFQWLEFDSRFLLTAQKVDQTGGLVQSPLDISMNIKKMEETTRQEKKDLSTVIANTFLKA